MEETGQEHQSLQEEMHNKTSDSIELAQGTSLANQKIFEVHEANLSDDEEEAQPEFKQQSLYEVMKSHLIPDSKMEEIDQHFSQDDSDPVPKSQVKSQFI